MQMSRADMHTAIFYVRNTLRATQLEFRETMQEIERAYA